MTTLLPAHTSRGRLAAAVCVAFATLAITAPASPVRSDVKPLGACSVRPTADALPWETPLLDAWRVRDGVSEILHDVHCSDGRVDRVWIGADII